MTTTILLPLEQKLLDSGYDSFTLSDKNGLISIIANKEGLTYSDITDAKVLDYHKQLKIDVLSDTCNNTIINGFTSSNGNQYRLKRDDQINMAGKMLELLNDTTITTVKWKTLNAGSIDHTRDDWIQHVFLEGKNFKENNIEKYDGLVDQVNAATTDAAILSIVWS